MKSYFKLKKLEKMYNEVKNDYMFKDYSKEDCIAILFELLERKLK